MPDNPRRTDTEGQSELWALAEGKALKDAWRVIPKRPKRAPQLQRSEPVISAMYYLGQPAKVNARRKPRALVPLNPEILGNRVAQRPAWGERGELYLWLPAVDAMDRPEVEPTKLLIDPSPEALSPRFVFDVPEPIDPSRRRVCPGWFSDGYKEVQQSHRLMTECRRQLSLRTDLSKVVYARIPVPGRVMLPIANGIGGPFESGDIDLPPAGLQAEHLKFVRAEDDPPGPRAHVTHQYRNPMTPPPAPVQHGVIPLSHKGLRDDTSPEASASEHEVQP